MNNLDLGEEDGDLSSRERNTAQIKVYVGNLPGSITIERVREFMSQFGNVLSLNLINRNPNKVFAFIEYAETKSYKAAIAANGIKLENRSLVINRHYPTSQAEDGSKEFQRTIFVGNVPLGMDSDYLKKVVFDAISPIQADFRTHRQEASQKNTKGMKLIKTDNGPEFKIFAFLVFRTMEETFKAGNILFDIELEGQKPIVEFSKGRKMHQYRANQVRILHVSNLAYSIDKEQLTNRFRLFGELVEVRLIRDRNTGQSKGYGFLEFRSPADAEHAVTVLSGVKWMGRDMVVQLEANEKRRIEEEQMGLQGGMGMGGIGGMCMGGMGMGMGMGLGMGPGPGPGPRRPRFDGGMFNMGPNFPSQDMSPRFNRMRTPQNDFNFGAEAGPGPFNAPNTFNAPSIDRIDRTMINRTVENNGTETTLFVSNLPNAADHKVRFLLEQLTGPMVNFKKEGPDGWLTYEDMQCAKLAHDMLREHRIQGIRLVVEILGENDLSTASRPVLRRPPIGGASDIGNTWSEKLHLDGGSGGGMWGGNRNQAPSLKRPRSSEQETSGSKLFVGNLTFDISKIDLHMLFSKYGNIQQIYLPTKEGNPSGYGFVVFNSPEDASRAQRMMNGYHLGGRRLRVEQATSKGPKDEGGGSAKKPHLENGGGVRV